MRSILCVSLCLCIVLCGCVSINRCTCGGGKLRIDPEIVQEISTSHDVVYIERSKNSNVYTVRMYWTNDVFMCTHDYETAIYMISTINTAWERSTLQERILFITQ